MALYDLLDPTNLPLQQLLLDPNNPRFAELGEAVDVVPEVRFAEATVQRDALERMKVPRFDVAELRDTIKILGYLPVDRIVVRRWQGGAEEKYVVIEGNRRVAALRWLVDLHEAGRETFSNAQMENFEDIPVLLLDDERAPESARLLIPGLRHVSGVKGWGPYQRAKAVFVLRNGGQSPQEVAQSLGLSTRAANRLWRSYLALEQMREDEEYGEFVDARKFSYFEEIIKQPNVRGWLEWSDTDERFGNAQKLHEFYGWIVGEPEDDEEEGERRDPKLLEAKSIRQLSRFIEDDTALAVFRAPDGNLTRALSRYEAEHPEAWQGAVANAETLLASLTPDTLRGMTDQDQRLLDALGVRLQRVIDDRNRLVGDQ